MSKSKLKQEGCKFILELEEVEPTVTAEEAWETAKQIMFDEKFSIAELEEIFGTRNHFAIMRDYTPLEAKAKIEAWEKKKAEEEEFKVGDVVVVIKNRERGVVTRVDGKYIVALLDCGITGTIKKHYVEKTGEHIDLEAVLNQLKPISDEVAKDHAEHFWEHRG